MSFFAELKRRNVIRAAGLYLVGAWLVVQVASTVLPAFNVAGWVLRGLIILLAIGFIPALIFSWVFELTPEGIKRDDDVSAEESIAPDTARRMDRAIISILALALLYFGFDKFVLAPRREEAQIAQAVRSTAHQATAQLTPAINHKSIAVLPFENLSDDKGNAYFAGGMQDMILTKLAGIHDLKVISRTSTEKYKSHPDDLKLIAQQLGVATILEGSVQKSGNQVLINVQLIDAVTDNHLWAEAYPRALNNIFGVEGEVAQKVADALKAKLTPAETASVAKEPTQNAAALDLFLKAEYQAQQALSSQDGSDYLAADADYRRAIALDPGFALAYAQLAYNQLGRHWTVKRLSTSELADVKTSLDRSLVLAPDLPEAHLALGYYDYWGFHSYDDAIAEFQHTLQLAPNNVHALEGLAYVARRTGHWPQALTYFDKALLVSPRDVDLRGEYGTTLEVLRHYPEADQQLRLALSLDPTAANAKDSLLEARLFGFGDVPGARAAYRSPPGWRISDQNLVGGDVMKLVNPRVYPDVVERHFAEALHDWDAAPTDTLEERLTGQVARVAIKVIAGQRHSAQPECEQLASQLQTELARQPDSLSLHQKLGWIDVCLGRNTQAAAASQRAVALLPIEKDAVDGAGQLVGLAQIDAWADAPEDALKLIRQLLDMPAGHVMSIERLKLDPVWDPLRKDPRFQALLAAHLSDEKGAHP